jgi:hypothetical protein
LYVPYIGVPYHRAFNFQSLTLYVVNLCMFVRYGIVLIGNYEDSSRRNLIRFEKIKILDFSLGKKTMCAIDFNSLSRGCLVSPSRKVNKVSL